MADLREKIEAETENIEQILLEIKKAPGVAAASAVELAGIGAFIHNFYNSIENILKQVVLSIGKPVSTGSFWHRDLLESAVLLGILSERVKRKLGVYLAFRHFFVHGYSLDLKADRISPLVRDIESVYEDFKNDLRRHGSL